MTEPNIENLQKQCGRQEYDPAKYVEESSLEVLRYLERCGLLVQSTSTNDNVDDDNPTVNDRLVMYWSPENNNDSNNSSKRIEFDHEGCVTLLDLGGKRLHRGFPLPSSSSSTTPATTPKPQSQSSTTIVLPPFEKFHKLTTLNLAGTDLPIQDTVQVLNQISSTIQTLYLGGNGLGSLGATSLASWLSSSSSSLSSLSTPPNLTKLDLRYNDLGSEGMTILCNDGISKMTLSTIRQLYVEGNTIGDTGIEALSQLLIQQGNNNKHNNNKTKHQTPSSIVDDDDTHDSDEKQSPSSSSFGLQEIYLGANQISAVGAKMLASTLHSNKIITKLYLEGNNIGLAGANEFSDVLEELNGHTNLEYLFVDNNNIGKAGSKRLANALNSRTAIVDGIV